MKRFIHIILFLYSCNVFSQEIKNVSFSTTDDNVIVSYDLVNTPSSWSYDIRIEAEVVDKYGTKKRIVAKAVEGDLKKIKKGRNKTVEWKVFDDVNELNGKLTITVRIIDSHYFKSKPKKTYAQNKVSTNNLKGPEYAILSFFLPGSGDPFVSNKKGVEKRAVLISAAYVVSGLLTYSYYSISKEDYKLYQSATQQIKIDEYYESANSAYRSSKIMLGVTAGILITDVIYVFTKGLINNRRNKKSYGFLKNMNLNFVFVNDSYRFGFNTKF